MTGRASLRMIARDGAAAAADPTDFTPTPAPVARAICELESWGPLVWEPACGDGAISGEFFRRGHDVVETDLVPRGTGSRLDFLQARTLVAPDIVTNQPFNQSDAFVGKAIDLGARKILMLLPLGWMQASGGRRVLLEQSGLVRIWVSARRIPFLRGGTDAGQGGGSPLKHALFVWERGAVGPAQTRFFDWRDFA